MDEDQRKRFEQAVERKKEASEDASHRTGRNPVADAPDLEDPSISATAQDAVDPRDKNSQKGKKTADKWNQ